MSDRVRCCRICGKPENDHNVRHAFVGVGEAGTLTEKPENREENAAHQSSQAPMSGSLGSNGAVPAADPVLRMALIRKGLLTPGDLTQIENELRVIGYAVSTPQEGTISGFQDFGSSEPPRDYPLASHIIRDLVGDRKDERA